MLNDNESKLHEKTKETIESLNKEEAMDIVYHKWITPIIKGLYHLPIELTEQLSQKVEALQEKYAVTFADIESEIQETEQELLGYLNELVGSESDMVGLEEFKKILAGE